MDFCVYLLTNTVTGKHYVGICKGAAEKRFAKHKKNAANGRPSVLYSSMRKHGADAFTCEELVRVPSWEGACYLERDMIETISPAYNMTGGGEGMYNPSPETRARMSESQKRRAEDPEYREMISRRSKAHMAMPARRELATATFRAFWKSDKAEDFRKKTSDRFRAYTQSPEGRAHIVAQCHKNNRLKRESAEKKKAERVWVRDQEFRKRQSEAAKRRMQTPEGQAQIRRAVEARIAAQKRRAEEKRAAKA